MYIWWLGVFFLPYLHWRLLNLVLLVSSDILYHILFFWKIRHEFLILAWLVKVNAVPFDDKCYFCHSFDKFIKVNFFIILDLLVPRDTFLIISLSEYDFVIYAWLFIVHALNVMENAISVITPVRCLTEDLACNFAPIICLSGQFQTSSGL